MLHVLKKVSFADTVQNHKEHTFTVEARPDYYVDKEA